MNSCNYLEGESSPGLGKRVGATLLLLVFALKESGRWRAMVKCLLGNNHPFQMEWDLFTMECVPRGSTA